MCEFQNRPLSQADDAAVSNLLRNPASVSVVSRQEIEQLDLALVCDAFVLMADGEDRIELLPDTQVS